jgi:hypothetical protein
MIPSKLTIAIMPKGATVSLGSWCGYDCRDTMDEARVLAGKRAAQTSKYQAVAVFPSHHWNCGSVSCKPLVLFDNTDYSNAPIRQCGNLINAASSTVL